MERINRENIFVIFSLKSTLPYLVKLFESGIEFLSELCNFVILGGDFIRSCAQFSLQFVSSFFLLRTFNLTESL